MVESELSKIKDAISKGFSQWKFFWLLRQLVIALGVAFMLCIVLLSIGTKFHLAGIVAITFGTIVFLINSHFKPFGYPAYSAYYRQLHTVNPVLAWSAKTLWATNPTLIDQLQQKRILASLNQKPLLIPKAPHSWVKSLVLLIGFILICQLVWFIVKSPVVEQFSQSFIKVENKEPTEAIPEILPQKAIPGIGKIKMRVAPPAYTAKPAFEVNAQDNKIPEGSKVTWQVWPEGKVGSMILLPGTREEINFIKTSNGRFVAQQTARESFIYRIKAINSDSSVLTPYYQLTVVPDQPPLVTIEGIAQYTADYTGKALSFTIAAEDDWGLQNTWLEMTISRGSGENVKFSIEKKWFEVSGSKGLKQKVNISPKELGLNPGDELYFRLVAQDNKQPRSQESSTSSWFYRWQNKEETETFTGGLALDIQPEFFRSQRQIIIDTEKLLAEQQRISNASFNSKSENIGVDQKLLRLRYGQFLGEEFETSVGPTSAGVAEEDHEGHDHAPGEHVYSQEEVNQLRNPLEEYAHTHDTEEGATFYEESVKNRLKTALAQMWESELYLRTHRPGKALPYQYKALEIIKAIQQQTRVYVERVGFEAPQIIEGEVRLQGEKPVNRLKLTINQYKEKDSLLYIKNAIVLLSNPHLTLAKQKALNDAFEQLSQYISQRLTKTNTDEAGQLLSLLNAIEERPSGGLSAEKRTEIKNELIQLVPKAVPQVQKAKVKPQFFN